MKEENSFDQNFDLKSKSSKEVEHSFEEQIRIRDEAIAELEELIKELKFAKERYRSLFENVPIGLIRTTYEGKVLDANMVAVALFGYPDKKSLMKVNATEFYLDEQVRHRAQNLLQRDTFLSQHEAQLWRYDGSIFWAEINSRAIRDQDGKLIYYEASIQDISARKEIEKALRESEAHYRNLFEKSVEAIYLYDFEEGKIIDTNPAFQNLLDYTETECRGLTLYDFIHHDKESIDNFLKIIVNSGGVNIGDRLWKKRDGALVDVSVTANKIRQEGRDFIFVIARDIREQKRRAQEVSTLLEFSKALSSTLETDRVLAIIAEQMVKVSETTRCTISRIDWQNNQLVTWIDWQRSESKTIRKPGSVYSLEDFSAAKSVINNRKPLVIQLGDSLVDRAEIPQKVIQDTHNSLMLPLIIENAVIGLIELSDDSSEREFSKDQTRLCQVLADQAAVAIRNTQLFEASRIQLQKLTLLNKVASLVVEITDEQELLQVVTQIIGDEMHLDRFGVGIIDLESNVIQIKPEYVDGDFLSESQQVPIGSGIVGNVAVKGELWYLPDVSEEDKYLNVDPRIRSELAVPIKVRNRIIGVLNAESSQLNYFGVTDIRLMTILADQIGTGIEKIRLLKELRQQTRELFTLLEVSTVISSTLELEEILRLIVREITRTLAVSGCTLSRWDKRANVLETWIRWRERTPDMIDESKKLYSLDEYPETMDVLKTRFPKIIRVSDLDASMPKFSYVKEQSGQCVLIIPLTVGENVIGLMELFDEDEEREFKADQVRFAQALAEQATVAIENARLYDETRRHAEQLEILAKISMELRKFDSPVEMLPVLVEGLYVHLKLDGVMVRLFGRDHEDKIEEISRGKLMIPPLEEKHDYLITHDYESIGSLHDSMDRAEHSLFLGTIQPVACLPLVSQKNSVGEIWIGKKGNLEKDEISLLSAIGDIAANAIHRALLYENVRRSLKESRTLEKISQALNETLDLGKTLQLIVDSAQQLIPKANEIVLHMLDEGSQRLEPKAVSPLAKFRGRQLTMHMGEGVAGEAIADQQLIRISDVRADSRYLPGERSEIRSMVVVPIQRGERSLGTISLWSTEESSFTSADERLLSQLATSAAIAIENADIYQAERNQRQLSESLSEAATVLNSSLRLNEVLDQILEQARKVVPFHAANIMLAEDGFGRIVRYTGYLGDDVTLERLYSNRYSLEWPTFKKMTETRQPFYIPNTSKSSEWQLLEGREWIRAYLGVPLLFGDQLIGFLNISGNEAHYFGQEASRRLQAFAAHAAIAINNAKLLEEREERTRQLNTLHEFDRAITGSLHFEEIYRAFSEYASRLVKFDLLSILLLDGNEAVLVYVHGDGIEPLASGDRYGIQGTSFEWVRKQRRPLLEESGEKRTIKVINEKEFKGIQTTLLSPLVIKEEVIGTVFFGTNDLSTNFRDNQLIIQSMVDQLALSVENARLYHDLEQALEQEKTTRDQLIQAGKLAAMGRMVASVAHELNNPVQTIKNAIFLTQDELQKEQGAREFLEIASSEADRVASLIDRLRDVYRPRPLAEKKVVDLFGVLEDVQLLLRHHLERQSVRWVQTSALRRVKVLGFADQLKQVFLNLSLNSIEAMQPEGGVLSINITQNEDTRRVCIEFQDTGPGIKEGDLAKVFEPFYTTKDTGSGLGLAISFDIVQQHGGEIKVESAPGKGATFLIFLPMKILEEYHVGYISGEWKNTDD